jgi:hypothetical protein
MAPVQTHSSRLLKLAPAVKAIAAAASTLLGVSLLHKAHHRRRNIRRQRRNLAGPWSKKQPLRVAARFGFGRQIARPARASDERRRDLSNKARSEPSLRFIGVVNAALCRLADYAA